ncbi:MAG: uracil-DNA glycosylase family protein [Muribaculaceae bacterium]|nr:uracil-DNA glycosylase family protein [Muribaculaceae bacterium]
MNIELHPWALYIPDNAKILILGTFPPKPNKWSMEFYYPNFINDFWRIMGLIFFNDKNHFIDNTLKRFNINKIKYFLTEKSIAIGDSALEVKRLKDNASDKHLEIVKPLPLIETLKQIPDCSAIISTGEKAAQVIAQLTNTSIPNIGDYSKTSINGKEIKIFRMPSTSRAYPLAIEKKAQFYKEMFSSIGIL